MWAATLFERLGSALVLGALFIVWLIAVAVVTPYVAIMTTLSRVFPTLQLQPESD